ncbi:hypothetical protein LTR95_012392 [Oleoguttula sp. CCFEE 5521]
MAGEYRQIQCDRDQPYRPGSTDAGDAPVSQRRAGQLPAKTWAIRKLLLHVQYMCGKVERNEVMPKLPGRVRRWSRSGYVIAVKCADSVLTSGASFVDYLTSEGIARSEDAVMLMRRSDCVASYVTLQYNERIGPIMIPKGDFENTTIHALLGRPDAAPKTDNTAATTVYVFIEFAPEGLYGEENEEQEAADSIQDQIKAIDAKARKNRKSGIQTQAKSGSSSVHPLYMTASVRMLTFLKRSVGKLIKKEIKIEKEVPVKVEPSIKQEKEAEPIRPTTPQQSHKRALSQVSQLSPRGEEQRQAVYEEFSNPPANCTRSSARQRGEGA